MNLETEENYELAAKKPALSVGTILLGLLLISISVIITLFITMPEFAEALLQAKGQILKGVMVGATTLPVLLFITIKGGKKWYKQWWSWVAVGITCVALVTITFVGTSGSQPQDLNGGMNMEEGMNMEGTISEDMGMSDGVVIVE